MTGRTLGRGVGRSPLELAGIVVALVAMVGVGLLWGTGVVVGSILGSTLPGTGGEGIVAMLRSFPDVGRAWEPSIPSGVVWAVSGAVVAVFAPLVWTLARAGRMDEEGAQWAAAMDLRRAGLLVPDEPLSHAEIEEQPDET